MSSFTIHAIPSDVVERARQGHFDSPDPVATVIAEGGEPVRCCLRDAQPGDRCLLFNYEPPLPATPYRESGAVYVHLDPCESDLDPGTYPEDWIGRPQVLRAYDERGWIHPATTTHDGADPVAALERVLAQPGVVEVHSRNVAYGCYMFTATR